MNARMIGFEGMTRSDYDAAVRRRLRAMRWRHFRTRIGVAILRHPVLWWLAVQAVVIACLWAFGVGETGEGVISAQAVKQ